MPAQMPTYPVAAIDNTLRTLQLLNSRGQVRVVDVANHLHVARSTAHRILSMLTYHGFAEQDDARVYRVRIDHCQVGPATQLVAELAEPVLADVVADLDLTAHAVVLEGNGARFVVGVRADRSGAVNDRSGQLHPAHLTAGGRALLADLGPDALRDLFPSRISRQGLAVLDHVAIRRSLAVVRERGYAVNEGDNEAGINAVGVCVRDRRGPAVAALVAAGPADVLRRADFVRVARRLEHAAAVMGVRVTVARIA